MGGGSNSIKLDFHELGNIQTLGHLDEANLHLPLSLIFLSCCYLFLNMIFFFSSLLLKCIYNITLNNDFFFNYRL